MSMEVIEHYEAPSGGTTAIEFAVIPQTYTDLVIELCARERDAGDYVRFYLDINGTNSSISTRWLLGTNSSASSNNATNLVGYGINRYSSTANVFGNTEIYIPNYTSGNSKSISVNGTEQINLASAYAAISASIWSNNSPITSISIVSPGNIAQYSSATLYGITAGAQPLTYTLPVTSDLYAWYDAANSSSITASSGLVSEWADSSGNGIDATQATGSLQPAYGPVVVNGVPVPYFNADRLVANASLVGNALTVFTVGSKESQGGAFTYSRWASIWKDGVGANDYANASSILGVWAGTVYAYANNATIATVATSAANGIHNSAMRLDGSNVKIWHNGATATGTTGISLNADRITIGDAGLGTGDSYLNGFVAEHIIYNRVLTDQEVSDVQTYLANKWNL